MIFVIKQFIYVVIMNIKKKMTFARWSSDCYYRCHSTHFKRPMYLCLNEDIINKSGRCLASCCTIWHQYKNEKTWLQSIIKRG